MTTQPDWAHDYDLFFLMSCLAPAVGDEFVATGRVVKAGRKQVFTSGELHARRDDVAKLVATANTILVPSGVPIDLEMSTTGTETVQ